MTAGGIKQREEQSVTVLRNLHSTIAPFNTPPTFQLDPFSGIQKRTNLLDKLFKALIDKYTVLFQLLNRYENPSAAFDLWLFGLNSLNYFSSILLESISLILDPEIKYFREGPSSSFTTYILSLYSQLLHYKNLISNDQNERLNTVIENFEDQFKKTYMMVNYNLIKYDEVRDLLSQTNALVASLPIKKEDIVQKGYFKMSMNKLFKSTFLIEVYHLDNDHIALFKVDSGELPMTVSSPRHLLSRLVQGEYQLLHLGITLLFPIIRQNDLEMCEETRQGYKLRTSTGNDIILSLTCMDPVKWETHWKGCFKKLFSPKDLTTSTASKSEMALGKPSSTNINLLQEHEKLKTNPFIDDDLVTEVGLELDTHEVISLKEETAEKSTQSNGGFSLHKSNPFNKSMRPI